MIPVKQAPATGEPEYVNDRQRPDMVIRLPGQRELSVDAKVSPVADIPQRGIDWRLQELAEEPYRSQFSDNTKWIVLYIPSDDFLASAMAVDNSLIRRAGEQNVLLATPSIFLNLLAEVDKAWSKYREEFPDLGNEEWESLPEEHRAWLDPEYVEPQPFAELPPPIGRQREKAKEESDNGDRN
jgi:hypothetical protein